MALIDCSSTSLAWMRKRSVVGEKNSLRRLLINQLTVCVSPVVADPSSRKKAPAVLAVLEALVASETAGDPMSTQKWVRSSLRTLSDRLREAATRSAHLRSV